MFRDNLIIRAFQLAWILATLSLSTVGLLVILGMVRM